MGEIADMMLDGVLCQICGEYLGGDGSGFPMTCAACSREEKPKKRKKRKKKKKK